MNTNLISYYRDRANEYERVYSKPERQDELKTVTGILQSVFADKAVLEIACGTGYWTERIAATANSILATDINDTVIEIARQKNYKKAKVTFEIADFFNFHPARQYESLLGCFIWSHIQLQDIDRFIGIVSSLVIPGGTIVLMDNNFVEESSYPIISTDTQGNTFQTRTLDNGTTHLVLKNFPTKEFLLGKIDKIATDINFVNLKYYWILSYKQKAGS